MLTHDHTLVQDMVDRGELARDAAEGHRGSSSPAPWAADEIEVDHSAVPLVERGPADLCSDGLPRCVYRIGDRPACAEGPDAKRRAEALVRRALDEGAADNVSVIVVDLVAG